MDETEKFVESLTSYSDSDLRTAIALIVDPTCLTRNVNYIPDYEQNLNALAPLMERLGLALVPAEGGGWCCVDLTTEKINDSEVSFNEEPTLAFFDNNPCHAVCKAILVANFIAEHTNAGR